jgi:hypothetical protein
MVARFSERPVSTRFDHEVSRLGVSAWLLARILAEEIRYYRQAAQRTTSTPERNYLLLHAARLSDALKEPTLGQY